MHRAVRRLSITAGLFLAALCTTLLAAEYLRVHGATIIVTNTNDSGPGSLRQAIADASGGDTIQFDPALNGQTILLTSGELVVDNSITITGPGDNLLSVSRPFDGPDYRIFHVTPGRTVNMEGLTISNGKFFQPPGGVGCGIFIDNANVTINSCTISQNSNQNLGGGSIALRNTTIGSNRTGSAGTSAEIQLASVSLNIVRSKIINNRGGGVYNYRGALTITDSTISGNFNDFGGAIYGGAVIFNSTISGNSASSGGGIYADGPLTIRNSTLSGNSTFIQGGRGGAIWLVSPGGTIINCTFSGNTATDGGGIYLNAAVTMGHTIMQAGSSGGNVSGGAITSLGYNLSSDSSAGFTGPGDQSNTNPMLGGLQDNGGPTFTHALLPGSPAIDTGDPNFTPPPFTDQRGYLRVYNGRIDKGSLEVQPVPTPTPTPSLTPSATPTPTPLTPTPTPTATATASPSCFGRDPQCYDWTVDMTDSPDPVQAGDDLTYSITISVLGTQFPNFIEMTDTLPAGVELVSATTNDGACTGTSTIQCGIMVPFPASQAFVTLVVRPTVTGTINNTVILHAADWNPTNDSDTTTTQVIPAPSPTSAQALNLSTRMLVQAGDNVGIGGFIITGSGTQVTVRGLGPSLVGFGVPNPLADPVLELHGPPGFVTIMNDNWRDSQTQCLETPELRPTNDLEPAICGVFLDPGTYTAILRGKNNDTAIGLVEVYDVGQIANSKLANISTRGFVAIGNDIMIAGFILGRNAGNDSVLIRGIGPSLAEFGVPNPLPNPQLELRNSSGTLIRYNNDWMDDLTDFFCRQLQGPPINDLESCIGATLAPGQYTALLSGVNNGTGVGLVEIYDLLATGPIPSPTPVVTPSPTPSPSASPSPSPGPCMENWDSVIAPALPPGWVATNPDPGDGTMWVTSTSSPDTPPNSAFVPDQDGISDKVLDRQNITIHTTSAVMSFRNYYNTGFGDGIYWDGYVLEVSSPNISGGAFLDITDSHVGGSFVSGGYNGEIDGTANNPLAGRMAWSGNSFGYIDTVINLGPNLAGQTVTLRFRMGTDGAVAAPGVRVDTISISNATCP